MITDKHIIHTVRVGASGHKVRRDRRERYIPPVDTDPDLGGACTIGLHPASPHTNPLRRARLPVANKHVCRSVVVARHQVGGTRNERDVTSIATDRGPRRRAVRLHSRWRGDVDTTDQSDAFLSDMAIERTQRARTARRPSLRDGSGPPPGPILRTQTPSYNRCAATTSPVRNTARAERDVARSENVATVQSLECGRPSVGPRTALWIREPRIPKGFRHPHSSLVMMGSGVRVEPGWV